MKVLSSLKSAKTRHRDCKVVRRRDLQVQPAFQGSPALRRNNGCAAEGRRKAAFCVSVQPSLAQHHRPWMPPARPSVAARSRRGRRLDGVSLARRLTHRGPFTIRA